mmetsp:Transcript_42874/g.101793  ORF Transcript_42874/g.101793 Transcript_42874/m.101793 type:complete len:375 (-) Transcript_42874:674-1798(-)
MGHRSTWTRRWLWSSGTCAPSLVFSPRAGAGGHRPSPVVDGVLSHRRNTPVSSDTLPCCRYEAMGNCLAQQYGGSDAHTKFFKDQRGEWGALTQGEDVMTSLRRFYSNINTDPEKQDAMNLFLGRFIPQPGKTPVWELGNDSQSHASRGLLLDSGSPEASATGHPDSCETSFTGSCLCGGLGASEVLSHDVFSADCENGVTCSASCPRSDTGHHWRSEPNRVKLRFLWDVVDHPANRLSEVRFFTPAHSNHGMGSNASNSLDMFYKTKSYSLQDSFEFGDDRLNITGSDIAPFDASPNQFKQVAIVRNTMEGLGLTPLTPSARVKTHVFLATPTFLWGNRRTDIHPKTCSWHPERAALSGCNGTRMGGNRVMTL